MTYSLCNLSLIPRSPLAEIKDYSLTVLFEVNLIKIALCTLCKSFQIWKDLVFLLDIDDLILNSCESQLFWKPILLMHGFPAQQTWLDGFLYAAVSIPNYNGTRLMRLQSQTSRQGDCYLISIKETLWALKTNSPLTPESIRWTIKTDLSTTRGGESASLAVVEIQNISLSLSHGKFCNRKITFVMDL